MKRIMKNVLRLLFVLMLFLSVLPMRDASAARIALSTTQKTTYVGKSFKLKLNGASGKVVWSTSDEGIATVKKGKVTAVDAGTATITAKNSGKTYSCTVTVLEPVINYSKAELVEGETLTLKVKGATASSYTSSNQTVAKVSSTGEVTALTEGTATISVVCTNKRTYQCNITVLDYSFDSEAFGDDQRIRTSNNPENYVEFYIQDNLLYIEGKIIKDNLTDVMVTLGDYKQTASASSGNYFNVSVYIGSITEKTEVRLYTKISTDTYYWSYVYQTLYIEPTALDGYRFVTSLVLEHNIEILKHYINPKECLGDGVSQQVKQLSDSIVGDETDPYKQLWLINYWVADNIYYDYDFYYGKSKDISYSSDDVYENKRSVCAGYANLQCDLIRAQGIPCIEVSTYSAGISTKGYFDETNCDITTSNHAHVEAYLESEDRWITMDSTWDSRNKYENGEYSYKAPTITYFDCNLDFFSLSHKIINR